MHRFVLSAGLAGVVHARIEWMTKYNLSPDTTPRDLLPASSEDTTPSLVREDTYEVCKWRASGDTNQFKYDLTVETSLAPADPLQPTGDKFVETVDKCFPNFFADKASLYYPYPRSSFNYDLNTPWTPSAADKPRVDVDVSYDVGDTNTFVKVSPDPVDYKTFETDGPSILYKAIPNKRGTYNIVVNAFDFGAKVSKECATCVAVNDLYRPKGDKAKCPVKTAPVDNDTSQVFSKDTVNAYNDAVDKLLLYQSSATNNGCSDLRCDTVYLTEKTGTTDGTPSKVEDKSFDAVATVNAAKTALQAQWKSCMSKPFSDAEWTALKINPLGGDATKPAFQTCQRSCALGAELKEWFTEYTCDAPPPTPLAASRKTCVGDATEKCEYDQTLTFPSGDSLVKSVSVKLKVGPDSKSSFGGLIQDPATVLSAPYKSPYESTYNELHFDSQCVLPVNPTADQTAKYNAFCNFNIKLVDLFTFSATIADDEAVAGLFTLPPTTPPTSPPAKRNVDEIVYWTVKTGEDGTPQLVAPDTVLILTQFQTKWTFEAFTACGKVQAAVTWTAYVHRQEQLYVTDWLNSLFASRDKGCNVQDADFGVVQFSYDPTKTPFKVNENPPTPAVMYLDFDQEGTTITTPLSDALKDYTPHGQDQTTEVLGENPFIEASEVAAGSPPVDQDNVSSPVVVVGDQPTMLLSSTTDVEVLIKWKLLGLTCSWQYTDTTGASDPWISTATSTVAQEATSTDFAIQLENIDITRFKALCELKFQSVASTLTNTLSPVATDELKVQNCDVPRFNVGQPSDQGRFIKDTCDKTTWKSATWQPAPFQACGGSLVFADDSAKKTVLSTPPIDLTCCNAASLEPQFTCGAVDGTHTKWCNAVVATLYIQVEYGSQPDQPPQNVGYGKTAVRVGLQGQVSSFTIAKGYELVGIDKDGKTSTWIGDVKSLLQNDWDDRIVAVVLQKTSPTNAVQLFQQPNYDYPGPVYGATAGAQLVDAAVFLDGFVGSFHLQQGFQLEIVDTNGGYAKFTADNPTLNTNVKSFTVSKATPPTASLEYLGKGKSSVALGTVTMMTVVVVVAVVVMGKRRQQASTVDVEEGYVALMH
ncbi:hypothetical protein DYB36_009122 [Aphanomyces astaci]|uniref:Uncharacterized protein n=1 Tax=Aphanomyces astaci TaxID=112090 RepID=A0A397AMR0_APHAT|nr:hypothetical protein DYB36_009122 [Aphanomyces astaci]